MDDVFETWAPREIKRLRDEADTLQLALDKWLAQRGGSRRIRGVAPTSPTSNEDGQGRRSKHEPLYNAWENASLGGPLSYDDMERIAKTELGLNLERNILRSIVHTQKSVGRVRAEDGGYIWGRGQLKTEAAPPVQEDAA